MPKLERESIWDDWKFLDAMERKRDKHRKRIGRLTFDCFKTRIRDNDRTICVRGNPIGQGGDGSMNLLSILRGRTASVCETCGYFDGEET